MMAFLTIKQAGKCKLPCGAEQIEVININYRGCEGGRQTDIGGVKHLWIQVNEWEATRKTVLQKKNSACAGRFLISFSSPPPAGARSAGPAEAAWNAPRAKSHMHGMMQAAPHPLRHSPKFAGTAASAPRACPSPLQQRSPLKPRDCQERSSAAVSGRRRSARPPDITCHMCGV